MVEYAYNAWGKLESVTGSKADTIGVLNPIRYRGYYYDTELGLYYLQSRYYNPEMGRFISSDDAAMSMNALGDITAANLFAYCGNDPVNYVDDSGYDAIWLQDTNAVLGFGHTGLLISIEKDVWWHFYWGLQIKYRRIEFHFTSLSALNDVLNTTYDRIKKSKKPVYAGRYEKYIYFSGNFQKTHEAILRIFTRLEGKNRYFYFRKFNYLYGLFSSNCMQMSALYLSYGFKGNNNKLYNTLINIYFWYLIPNRAYRHLAKKLG